MAAIRSQNGAHAAPATPHLLRDPRQGPPLFPWPRRRGLDPDLGPDPRRRPQLHLARLVARRVPRPVHHDHRPLEQLPRRRAARFAGSARGQGSDRCV